MAPILEAKVRAYNALNRLVMTLYHPSHGYGEPEEFIDEALEACEALTLALRNAIGGTDHDD